jgi:serine/threonine-protein kinase RsbW
MVTFTGREGSQVDIEFAMALPRDAIGIPMVRRVLGDALRSLGVTEECVADIQLAASEACANAVRHGGPAGRYHVVATIGAGKCEVRIADRGHGLTTIPKQYPSPDTENGRGILIMQSVVDDVSFDTTPGNGTTVRLSKELDWADDQTARDHRRACQMASV